MLRDLWIHIEESANVYSETVCVVRIWDCVNNTSISVFIFAGVLRSVNGHIDING